MANPNPSKKWKKGQSGNPKGRPILNEELVQACRAETEENIKVLKKIRDGKNKGSEKAKAIEMLMDRAYGKPLQPTKDIKVGESYGEIINDLDGRKKKE